MKIQLEKWDNFYPDCLPLFAEHKAEIGESADRMPVDPAIDKCAALDKAGMLQIITARDNSGTMSGYCIFVIDYSLESKDVLIGEQKLWFVTKSARHGGLGIKLFMESIKLMKERGVKNIYPHRWMTVESKDLEKFFVGLGAYELERIYSLWIGE